MDPCIQIQSVSISATADWDAICLLISAHIRITTTLTPFSPWPVSSFCRMVGMRGRLSLAGLFSRSCCSQTTRTTPTSRPSTSTSRRWLSCKSIPTFHFYFRLRLLGCEPDTFYPHELTMSPSSHIVSLLTLAILYRMPLYICLSFNILQYIQYGKTHDVLTHIKTLYCTRTLYAKCVTVTSGFLQTSCSFPRCHKKAVHWTRTGQFL